MMCVVLALLAAPVMPMAAGPAVVYGAGNKIVEEVPEERIFDSAGLFDARERAHLEEMAASYRDEMGVDLVVVTAFNDGRHTAMEYADDFYDYGGFGENRCGRRSVSDLSGPAGLRHRGLLDLHYRSHDPDSHGQTHRHHEG